MSMGFIKNGKYVQVAGNPPPSGELVTGASTIRKGTVTGTTNYGYAQGTVTFDSPMPDADYEVTISFSDITPLHHTYMHVNVFEKTATGFKYSIRDTTYSESEQSTAQAISCTFYYTAFKLYTVEGVEELEADVDTINAKIPSSASASNQLVTQKDIKNNNYVGVDGSYSQTTGKDILAIADAYTVQNAASIYNFRFFDLDAVNAPEDRTNVDLLCTAYRISDTRYNKIVARNVRGNEVWINTKVNSSWTGWKKLAYSE